MFRNNLLHPNYTIWNEQNTNNYSRTKDSDHAYTIKLTTNNLAVLGSKDNKPISNESFDDKNQTYHKSSLAMLKRIADHDEWGVPEIDKRNRRIVEFCINSWSYSCGKYSI